MLGFLSKSARKRNGSALFASILNPIHSKSFTTNTEQAFLNPLRDAVAKHLLDNEIIRNYFIRSLTPFKDVESSKRYDNTLRPLKLNKNLLNILRRPDFVKFLHNESPKLPQTTPNEEIIYKFFSTVLKNYESIKQSFLDEKSPTSDVICKLGTGQYVLVEVQVANPGLETWNKRSLAYTAMLYANQL
jgi:hypothetical protein